MRRRLEIEDREKKGCETVFEELIFEGYVIVETGE